MTQNKIRYTDMTECENQNVKNLDDNHNNFDLGDVYEHIVKLVIEKQLWYYVGNRQHNKNVKLKNDPKISGNTIGSISETHNKNLVKTHKNITETHKTRKRILYKSE